jgi:nucleoside-diphosphate-sugar epimerase
MNVLITGASGGLGSHLVEAFTSRRHHVTGIVRSWASAGHLARTPATFVQADITEPASRWGIAAGHDCVIHTAARVGGNSRHRDHVRADQQGTANVLAAAVRGGCSRFIHISSIAVYELPTDGGSVSESTPLESCPARWNHYVSAKLQTERLVQEYHRQGRIAVTVLRPSIFLGRYDRHTTPHILRLLESPLAGIIGEGTNLIPCVTLSELADLVVNAAESGDAAGRTYNVSGRTGFSQRDLLETHAAALGRPVRRRVSRRVAWSVAALLDTVAGVASQESQPLLSRFIVMVAGMNCRIDCSLAAADLGWQGRSELAEAIRESVTWLRERRP